MRFVAVLVVHVVDCIKSVDSKRPVQYHIHIFEKTSSIKVLAPPGTVLRTNLLALSSRPPPLIAVKACLARFKTSTKELTNAHGADGK